MDYHPMIKRLQDAAYKCRNIAALDKLVADNASNLAMLQRNAPKQHADFLEELKIIRSVYEI